MCCSVDDVNDLELVALARLPRRTSSRPSRTSLSYGRISVTVHPSGRTPRKPTASPWAKTRCGRRSATTVGPRIRRFLSLPKLKATCARRSTAAPNSNSSGSSNTRHTARLFRTWPPSGRPMQAGRLPEGWDSKIPVFPADAKGYGHARLGRQGRERHRRASALADGRLGRPVAFDQNRHRLRALLRARDVGTQHALRHPRARHGRHPERHGGLQAESLRRDFHDFFRLHARVHPAGGDHAPAGHLCLYPRFHRTRRRRTHAPADRAPDCLARHSPSHRDSAREMPTKLPKRGATPSARPRAQPRWRSPARRFRPSIAARMAPAAGLHRGAYVLIESTNPEVILIGTGSELQLCVAAFENSSSRAYGRAWSACPRGKSSRSRMRRTSNLFCPIPFRPGCRSRRVQPLAWWRYVGPDGVAIGRDDFGASAPAKELFKHFGFTR